MNEECRFEPNSLKWKEEHVVEEKKTVVAPASTSVVNGDLTSYERLLRLLGLTKEADILVGSGDVSVVRRALASHVGTNLVMFESIDY